MPQVFPCAVGCSPGSSLGIDIKSTLDSKPLAQVGFGPVAWHKVLGLRLMSLDGRDESGGGWLCPELPRKQEAYSDPLETF